MVKRKSLDENEPECGKGVPFPIQTFLWRQTSAFLRPKLGKQYEASCVSFERVLVENKLHGLSPALSEAIQSISRWELVQAALPHVLHCTSILLSNRNKLGHQDKLGVAETKLLHTLHWMLLDAAQECNHEPIMGPGWSRGGSGSSAFLQPVGNQGSSPGVPGSGSGSALGGSGPQHGSSLLEDDEHARTKLFHKSMATVELFVFLFAPLIHRIKESDLTFRLASGLVIWQPMWEHRQPDIPAFTSLIKPVRNIVTAKRNSPVNNQCSPCGSGNPSPMGFQVVCEAAQSDSSSPAAGEQSCRRGNSVDKGGTSQQAPPSKGPSKKKTSAPAGLPPSLSQRARYATYFDVAVLRCLLQPHWTEEGVHWALMYYLQRLRQIMEERPERNPEPLVTPLPRPRSSSMVAATPSLVNTHKTQDMSLKCNEEGKSLSTETFAKVSLTNLRRQAVPDLSSDLGMNIFKKFKNRREDRERKGSIPFHHTGKKRQRRMGVPFLLHEDHLDVSPTRSTFSFGSFSGLGDERRALDRGGWQATIMGKFTRRGSTDTAADADSLSAKHSHSHHSLLRDMPDHSNSHSDNTVKEVRSQISTITMAAFNTTVASFNVGYADFFTEHMKKLCNPVAMPEIPAEPLACANLPRSFTDSCINYSCPEEGENIEGTNNFVLKNGMLDLTAILRALYAVLSHDISSRICDVALNIIDCLLQLGVVPGMGKKLSKPDNKENQEARAKDSVSQGLTGGVQGGGSISGDGGGGGGGSGGGSGQGSKDDVKNNKDNEKTDENSGLSTHRLALTMLIKIVKSLGCAYGCGEGHRGLSGDRLRMQSRDTVTDIGSPFSTSEPSIEPEGQSSGGTEDNYHRNMSWLHIMILLCNQQSFICTHIDFCHPRCYQHHGRSCARLVRAIKLVYGESVDSLRDDSSAAHTGGRAKKNKECSDKSCLRTPSMKRKPNDNSTEGKKDTGMLKYIRNQVMSLSPAPLSLLIKAAPILTDGMYGDIQPAAWELLLSVDEHMAAAAAAMFLLCAVKVPDAVTEMMTAEFQHQEACQRINSILKFYTLWRFRYQVWPRMEEGAQQIFKIPPPSINFTLPSPILGMPCVPIFDPPWVPQTTGSVQDPINEDQSKSFSARAVSRSHQRAEHILKNLQQEEEKRRLGREASIITAIPVAQEACYEPTCSPPPEQEEEAEEVVNLASRRLSVSPSCASSNSHRNYSFRRGSVWSIRSLASAEDEENTTEHTPTHHMLQPPQSVFPACICAAVLPIVHLMEDGEVREDGVAVSAVAQQILWNCLIEDPALVLRHFLEKLTVSNRQDELIYMLRKLLLNIGDMPAQTSHILFNYLVGLIMYFVRTPCEWGMDAISATLTFLWEVVVYVEGLFFKDLKQTMKKEQCEVKLLVTASMPGTKTLVVHGQNECDIPTQLPVHEDTQFDALLKECLEFFNIPDARSAHYFLMDKRWNLIHYNKTYVRDIYPFRRSVSPQLNLVHMLPEKGQELIQKQVFSRKLEEVGRVLFLISLTQRIPSMHKQSHVSLLQEDLLRLPSFPRTAIDAEFSLFNEPQGKELFGFDTLHKVLWIKLLEEMFLGMPSEYPWGDEMMLFLNVFNGALLLHPEDSSLLRQYTATAINTAVHFNHLFSLSGYQWILPTMLQVYADYESNPLLRQGIEFCCRQFYILHRKPFVLQLFASVAPLLEFTTSTSTGLSKGVSAQCLFDLMVSLEGETLDALDALELVKAEKPLRSLDFCYGNEDLAFSISEAIKLCVTVAAYAPESFRSFQMLMVLEALVPCYLQKLKSNTVTMESASAARDEIAAIAALATSLQALLYSSESLTRPMTAPQISRGDQGHKGGTTANHTMSGGINTRDNLHLVEEGQGMPKEELDERNAREEFRRPRESLLNICTEFYKHCGPRLKILQNVAGEPRVTALELLDIKSHMRLAEIAHALLKLAPYDTLTMESRGLRRYIMEMLPITDWSSEAVRPALILILKRLDRMFNKIHKMPTLRRQVEWEAASNLIEGICLTLQRQPIISFLPHLRSLINVCVNLVMGVVGPSSVADGLPLLHLSPYLSPPLPFSTAVVRLVALQIQALKDDFPLSHVISPFTNQERREGMLLNLLIPFVLTVGSGSKDSPHLEQPEVFLLLQTVINILLPPRIISTSRTKNFMLDASPAHCSTPGDTGKDLRREGLAESTSQAAYLALKVVLVCFERSLGNQWYRLSLQVKEMALRKVGGLAFWDFIDFIVRTRIPIFVLLRPFIQCKLLTQPADSQEEITARHHIADQLERRFIPRPLCKSSLFAEFNNELKILKEAVHSGSAYQGKTSISTVGTSTSAYRLSLATMSRSNTGTGTVWEQDSQPSRQPSQDTLSRTDEDDEENDSMSIPSVVSEHEAFLPRVMSQRRFSSHVTGSASLQPEATRTTMLPSQSEPNVLDEFQGLLQEGSLSRVASVQSEPGQQNLLIQPPLGRKRGLRQLRRPLLSIPKTEPRGRSGARLSTTRRSIQPKNKPLETLLDCEAHGDQKRSVTFTETQNQQACQGTAETPAEDARASPAPSKSPTLEVPPVVTATVNPDVRTQGPSGIRESPGDEDTTALLPPCDTLLQLSEDDGTENPLLTPLLSAPSPHHSSYRFPLPLSPVDLDLDESHV
uniref:Unc-80 homolog n=1 Tax=Nothobranchius kadleci TaxID=1051664 RepID=A0A1A8CPY5_NOTKA